MFFKYLALNIRHNIPKYVLLVVCLIASIVAALAANGILMDELNEVGWTASCMTVRFDKRNISEVQEKLYEFLSETEPAYTMAHISLTLSRYPIQTEGSNEADYTYLEEYAKTYGNTEIWLFPSYEEMKRYLKNVQGVGENSFPTREQYENEKVIILGKDAEYYELEPPHTAVNAPYTYTDDDHVLINGEEYLVVGKYGGYPAFAFGGGISENMLMSSISIYFGSIPTLSQVDEMTARFIEKAGGVSEIQEPKTRELLDERESAANIVTTALIQLIAVFNVLIIYSSIIESRKRQFAVMRFCGFKKAVCLRYMWGEMIVLGTFSLPIACVVFESIKPTLVNNFPTVSVMFTPAYYVLLGLLFLLTASIAFAAYIVPSFGKTISSELLEV